MCLTGNWIGDLSVRRLALSPLSRTSQGYWEFFLSWMNVQFWQMPFVHWFKWSVVFILYVIDTGCYMSWPLDVKPTIHSWDKPCLAMVCTSFYILVDSVCLVFCWGFFRQYLWEILVFPCDILSGVGIWVIGIGKCSPSLLFFTSFLCWAYFPGEPAHRASHITILRVEFCLTGY